MINLLLRQFAVRSAVKHYFGIQATVVRVGGAGGRCFLLSSFGSVAVYLLHRRVVLGPSCRRDGSFLLDLFGGGNIDGGSHSQESSVPAQVVCGNLDRTCKGSTTPLVLTRELRT